MRHSLWLALKAALVLTCGMVNSGSVLAAEPNSATLRVGAALVPFTEIIKKYGTVFTLQSGIKLVTLGSPEKGMVSDAIFLAVLKDQADVGIAGLEWVDWLALVRAKGLPSGGEKQMHYRDVHREPIAFLASGDVPKRLTTEQLHDLFSGKVRNWKAVGGTDLPVTLVYLRSWRGIELQVRRQILGGKDLRRDGTVLTDNLDQFSKALAQTPGSLAFGPPTAASEKVRAIDTVKLSRPILVITRGEPSPSAQKLIDYIEHKLSPN